MHLGQLLGALEDEGYAAGALDALGDVVLLAEVHAMRGRHDETPGEYVANASRRFAARATDEDWLALMNAIERADEPARAALTQMVRWAIAGDAAEIVALASPPAAPEDHGHHHAHDHGHGCGGGGCGCGGH